MYMYDLLHMHCIQSSDRTSFALFKSTIIYIDEYIYICNTRLLYNILTVNPLTTDNFPDLLNGTLEGIEINV